jgi:hypothetical protein
MGGVPPLPGAFLSASRTASTKPIAGSSFGLSHWRLALYQRNIERRPTYYSSMNPQLLGDPSNRSATILIFASDLLE